MHLRPSASLFPHLAINYLTHDVRPPGFWQVSPCLFLARTPFQAYLPFMGGFRKLRATYIFLHGMKECMRHEINGEDHNYLRLSINSNSDFIILQSAGPIHHPSLSHYSAHCSHLSSDSIHLFFIIIEYYCSPFILLYIYIYFGTART